MHDSVSAVLLNPECQRQLTYMDALFLLNLRIHYFSVVQHHGPASRPAVRCPSQTLGKPGIRIGQEELLWSVMNIVRRGLV